MGVAVRRTMPGADGHLEERLKALTLPSPEMGEGIIRAQGALDD